MPLYKGFRKRSQQLANFFGERFAHGLAMPPAIAADPVKEGTGEAVRDWFFCGISEFCADGQPAGQPPWQAREEVIGTEPDPAFAVQIADEFQVLLARLTDDRLREIALLKLDGYTNEEIAERLHCSPRSVTRRLTVIRRVWSEGQ
jgi:DNA-directed RNA polymerase specialized sigma24 family protein